MEKSDFNPDLSNFKLQALSTELYAFHEKERGCYLFSECYHIPGAPDWIQESKSAKVLVVSLQWQAAGTGVGGVPG